MNHLPEGEGSEGRHDEFPAGRIAPRTTVCIHDAVAMRQRLLDLFGITNL
jgi:hypothetical protein